MRFISGIKNIEEKIKEPGLCYDSFLVGFFTLSSSSSSPIRSMHKNNNNNNKKIDTPE
jgi:hypothetical protein